jgi:DNA-binding IclR family transcriptional regulator
VVRFPAAYDRQRDLPKLLRLWPGEVLQLAEADHPRLLAMLRQALRAERQRGVCRSWSYDIARHRALARAVRAESGKEPGKSPAAHRAQGFS